MLNRRQLIGALAAFGTTAYGGGLSHRRRARRPNVLMIILDDLRPQLGCYGLSHVVSPNIDALARDGVLFERARAQVALCTPSRGCFLSGLRPDTTGVYELKDRLMERAPQAMSMPRYFRQNGYRTIALGKVFHHGILEDAEAWSEPPRDDVKHMDDYLDPASLEIVRRSKRHRGGDGRRGPSGEAPDVPDEAYGDGQIVAQALAELSRPQAGPLFLAVGLHRPHMPFNVPRRYWDLYDPASLPLPEPRTLPKGCPSIAAPNHKSGGYTDMPLDGTRSEADLRRLLHGYHAAVSYADALVGQLMDGLDASGLGRDTVVALLGDHGMHLGDHGLWGKHSCFDMAAHAPLILRMPDGEHAGRRVEKLVELVDLFPTLCDVANLDPIDTLEGESMLRLIASEDHPWKSAVFWQYLRRGVMGRTLRTPEWRYTRWNKLETDEVVAVELYDHTNDPLETVNLKRTADPALLAELDARLDLGWRGAASPRRRR